MIKIGTCSWAEKTFLQSGFYPDNIKTPQDRLQYYTGYFNTVEVDSTYYAIPAQQITQLWAQRTPDNFIFNVKAYGALTGHTTDYKTLPKDIRQSMPQTQLDKTNAIITDKTILNEIAHRFYCTLTPLKQSGKLGVIVFQYPPWFYFSLPNLNQLLKVKQWMPDLKIGIEFRHGSWLTDKHFNTVVSFLKENDFIYITADSPQYDSLATIPFKPYLTSDTAYLRFHGRNKLNWLKKGIETSLRYNYEYSVEEITGFVNPITDLDKSALVTFVVFNNCHGRKAIDNAIMLQNIFARH